MFGDDSRRITSAGGRDLGFVEPRFSWYSCPVPAFCSGSKVVHIDLDTYEIANFGSGLLGDRKPPGAGAALEMMTVRRKRLERSVPS